jgi:CheY-like chemotaxis protein
VILDHQMPGMDGGALACRIKNDPLMAATPLVMLSSVGQREESGEPWQEWIAALLAKPVRKAQLYECIALTLGPSTARAASGGALRDVAETAVPPHARVLLAEDNAVNQRVAVRMLEKLGCQVDVAANGREAVESVWRSSYDCVFMDCQMPEMDGFEATAAIRRREDPGDLHVPIIAITAHAMQGDRDRCLSAGMDDYLSKPVGAEALRTMLQKWVRRPDGVAVT